MLNIVRGTSEELARVSNDFLVYTNPGPMYLLINAIAVTTVIYIASFRLLNVGNPLFAI